MIGNSTVVCEQDISFRPFLLSRLQAELQYRRQHGLTITFMLATIPASLYIIRRRDNNHLIILTPLLHTMKPMLTPAALHVTTEGPRDEDHPPFRI